MIFQREVHINYRCLSDIEKKYARLDFLVETSAKRIIVEVDERQHKDTSYSIQCDISRMTYVQAAIALDKNTRPTLWIRFNPNAFQIDGKTVRVSRQRRYDMLYEYIQNPKYVGVVYMYYDVDTNGVVCITKDNAFTTSFKKMILQPVLN